MEENRTERIVRILEDEILTEVFRGLVEQVQIEADFMTIVFSPKVSWERIVAAAFQLSAMYKTVCVKCEVVVEKDRETGEIYETRSVEMNSGKETDYQVIMCYPYEIPILDWDEEGYFNL